VTVGRFIIEKSFLLGPAVDEAAALHETADGAFVWFAPRAARLPRPSYGGPDVWKTMIFRHPVPFKDGRRLTTNVVSPFLDSSPGIEERTRIRAGYKRAMTSDIDAAGVAMGVEITAPGAVTVADLNSVLVKHGLPALDDKEWAPLAA
jgi:hypothetical protein